MKPIKETLLTLTDKNHFVARRTLIRKTGHSIDFVSRMLKELVEEGLMEEESFVTEISRGHPQVAYRSIK